MKVVGLVLLVTGSVMYWSIVLDPLLGLGVYFMLIGVGISLANVKGL